MVASGVVPYIALKQQRIEFGVQGIDLHSVAEVNINRSMDVHLSLTLTYRGAFSCVQDTRGLFRLARRGSSRSVELGGAIRLGIELVFIDLRREQVGVTVIVLEHIDELEREVGSTRRRDRARRHCRNVLRWFGSRSSDSSCCLIVLAKHACAREARSARLELVGYGSHACMA